MVLFTTKMAQPALLYLCPLTLGTTVFCAYLRGGLVELRNLWNSNFPMPSHILDNTNGSLATDSNIFDPLGDRSAVPRSIVGIPDSGTVPVEICIEDKGMFSRDRHLNL